MAVRDKAQNARRATLLGAALAAISGGAAHANEATITEAITKGTVILEARARYEGVDQVGIANEAEAFTLRTRLGWETASWGDIKALIEFEDVRQLGSENYNVQVPGVAPSLNGQTAYPIVNDPDVTELNRAQLTWTPSGNFSVVAGRQRILFDDQRFVGNVGWRQDEQTFDGVRGDATFGKLKGTYAYVNHVNRILGEERDWDSESHLLNFGYSVAEQLRLQGFVYALALMVHFARTGVRVVRLKGGDPSVFGRLTEERDYLQARGIETETVPGITAASAAAAQFRFSLTERDVARRVLLTTARASGGAACFPDQALLADKQATVVFYMAAHVADAIRGAALRAGRAGETPVLLVENAGSAGARASEGRLWELPDMVTSAGFTGPCLVVMGDVARLPAPFLRAEALSA